MSDEIWRKECRAYLSTLPGYARAGFSSKQAEMVYIEAKKSSQLKIEELEHKLEMAIETLEFYGNIDSWYQDDMDIFDYTILPSDVEQKIHPKTGNSHIAGKRARQVLEQLK